MILATLTASIALLRTVAFGWRQEALSREVATVQQLGRELRNRFGMWTASARNSARP
ncbi:DNA recombination protein RmuC [Nocardia sp. R16R-3T]